MPSRTTDILIAGGGIAGLTAAAALGHAGFDVLVVDPAPVKSPVSKTQPDLRSTAFLQPAKQLFHDIEIWDAFEAMAVPLKALRIVDTQGTPPSVMGERQFEASDLNDQPFGWNLLNSVTHAALIERLSDSPNVTILNKIGFDSAVTRTTGVVVTLTNGERVTAKLLVGADGRDSTVRSALDIGVKTTRYGQKSLAFVARHEVPHNSVSTEIYNKGGPFTLVPLPDLEGSPASAIVWMNDGRTSLDLAQMDEVDFNTAMTERAARLFGEMRLASHRAVWPIISQQAESMIGQRTALIAEAAHVFPPIGAQGLNTSINDVIALRDIAISHPNALGSSAMLDAYTKSRSADVARRFHAIDAFNRIAGSGNERIQALRLEGLKAVHDVAPLRRKIMKMGMGPG